MTERVLITGGMGFIGLHTARRLLDTGAEVVLTCHRVRREPDFLQRELGAQAAVATLDLLDGPALQAVMRQHRVDSVIHLAVPGLNELGPAEDIRANVLGLVSVLEAARALDVRRLTIASSITVYDGARRGPWGEDLPLPVRSPSPTATFKKTIEILTHDYADRSRLPVCMLRVGRVYGPLYHSMANLPSLLVHYAAGRLADPQLPPLDDRHGSDYCYVTDCARAIQLAHQATSLGHRTYNVGAGAFVTNGQLARALRAAAPRVGLPPSRRHDEPDDDLGAFMDIGRIRKDLAFEPEVSIFAGMQRYLHWTEEHDY